MRKSDPDPYCAHVPSSNSKRTRAKNNVDWGDAHRRLTPQVSVLVGPENGAYPSGNSLLIQGTEESALIDPSVTVVAKGGAPCGVDIIVNSHAHEDHVAGNGLFANARVHIHNDDLPAVQSIDGLMAVYGFTGEVESNFRSTVVEEFSFEPRPDAEGFGDGHVFDLGGGVEINAVHLPGHTRGHSGFVIDNVCFLSDIDLTGFGPYYGDTWSDLEQFDESLTKAREIEADWYVTFHHKGVIEGRPLFLELIDKYHAVINDRHQRMLDFLAVPRSLDEMASHRFVYRPKVTVPYVPMVERRVAEMHVDRMLRRGEASEVESGMYMSAA